MKKVPAPITVEHGQVLEQVIFKGCRKPMSRRDLHVALEPIFRRWLQAVSGWDDPVIGDYKFVVFSLEVAPETEVYVQFWSEPFEPVRWEVSSGTWNPPADEWLAGDRARRIEAMGFQIGGRAGNYSRLVEMKRTAGIAAVAKAVVEVFYAGFDYRGTRPIHARLAHDGRSAMDRTFDAFTPEDVGKVFAGLGFVVEEPVDEADDGATAVIRCRKGRSCTMVDFDERVEDENVYRRIRLSADVALPAAERARLKAAPGAPEGAEPYATVSVVLPFGGGVTIPWLIERIHEWDAMLAGERRAARRRVKQVAGELAETVH
jgi:hypothetical protein